MSARVLVVDDIPANVKLLEAKLTAEYFEVRTAANGPEALRMIEAQPPDLVLLDVMMPGMDGFEVCGRIRADPRTVHLPVVMVTALSDAADRVRGLEAGADDFLTKPVNDLALFARVRSLLRLKMMMDELRLREETRGQFGLAPGPDEAAAETGRVLLVEPDEIEGAAVAATLAERGHVVTAVGSGAEAIGRGRQAAFDLIIVNLLVDDDSGLRLVSLLRSQEETRQVPILVLVDEQDAERLAKSLDIGANDYLVRPLDRNELVARARTQIRRKRYQDRLRDSYQTSLAAALTDSLTGLSNRRYMLRHLEGLLQRMRESGKPLSLMLFDIDRFKAVNDSYGHAAGDEVLRGIAQRITANIRSFDMVARYGGEEFVVLMPNTSAEVAVNVAERLRERIAAEPLLIGEAPGSLPVTISGGIATATEAEDTAEALLKRADAAMYRAKAGGRNRIVGQGAAGEERALRARTG